VDNPDMALPLYIAVIVVAFLLGPRWRPLLTTLTGSATSAQQKATA
jgi:hypothetical protein